MAVSGPEHGLNLMVGGADYPAGANMYLDCSSKVVLTILKEFPGYW
ncbi:MAG: hypothetical protein ABSA82_08885 [Thermacetogeniaceae bacterium]|jgi:hypothetical protein